MPSDDVHRAWDIERQAMIDYSFIDGSLASECPVCRKIRVEKTKCGKHRCSKCNWVIEDNSYFTVGL